MSAPKPKTNYTSIMDEMFSSILKSKNEVKIRSWKNKIDTLKNVNIFQYKLLVVTLTAYVNKNEEGIKIAQSIFPLLDDVGEKAAVYRTIGNLYFHQGDFNNAMNAYWEAFELTKNPEYFDAFVSVATSFDIYDARLSNMKSLDIEKQKIIGEEVCILKGEIERINSLNIDLGMYREVLSAAYTIFFRHCSGKIIRLPQIADTSISSILFNPLLDLKTVNLLNDEMADAQVQLLEKYEYDDLLKFPVLFTAENYSN